MVTRNRRTVARSRPVMLVVVVLVGLLTGSLGGVGTASADDVDPAVPQATRGDAWWCTDDVATSPRPPVLLVHGTGMGAGENWNTSLAPYLTARGHAVCLVALPSYGTGDVQDSVELVARAISDVSAAAGRRIDVVGHSQGAYLPRAALRLHPTLVGSVDDVVGIAGVYDAGSQQLTTRCVRLCVPALHQLAAGSDLLRAVSRRPLPVGPSYSNVGSVLDTTVTPQPAANAQRGTTSVLLQDVCPARDPLGSDHAVLVGDAVAAALVTDALDHDGPVVASRVPVETCDQTFYDGFDPVLFQSLGRLTGTRTSSGRIPAEPAVDCRLRPDCRFVTARGRLLRGVTWQTTPSRVILRATASTSGKVRLAAGRNQAQVTVVPGQEVVLWIPRPGRATLAFAATLPAYYSLWLEEQRTALRR